MEINKIYNEDCLEGMKRIADGSVDMILCDLPYGTTRCKWDTIIPFEPLWEQYERIIKTKGTIALTASGMFSAELIVSNRKLWKYNWVWDKVKPNGHLVAKIRPMQKTEDIVIFSKGKNCYNPQMIPRDSPKKSKEYRRTEIMGGKQTNGEERVLTYKYPNNVITVSNASQHGKLHPTQKPVALFEYLIKTYTNENDLVLDNCMGSGTTAIACMNTQRNFIGFELDKGYYDIACKRIEKHKEEIDGLPTEN